MIKFKTFDDCELYISRQHARDIVDVLSKVQDPDLTIHGKMEREHARRPTLGLHVNEIDGSHSIYLDPRKIYRATTMGLRAGGNRPVKNGSLAIAAVLAHEIQHMNQSVLHDDTFRKFYGSKRSKYKTRPCEVEARNFADANLHVLAGIIGVKFEKNESVFVPQSEVDDVIECFLEGEEKVSVQDIVDELRLSGVNNVVNVKKVKDALAPYGLLL